MQETQQSTKLRGHIDQLQQAHNDLDKQIIHEYVKYGDDAVVQSMKKRKLHLKDEIENYTKQLENLG